MLTVLFATRNRAQILRRVLEAYCCLQPPSSGWKLVIVDNGSTDDTAQVISSFATRLPLHSVAEPKMGKNRALNAGLKLIEGDLTVLTDDDAFPHADWLVQLRNAADAQSEYSIFGGPILPRWEVPRPRWTEWLDPRPVFAITPSSAEEGPTSLIFGPNMAIRNGIFQSGALFDPSIGPRGSDYPMGGETELVLRLFRQGHKAWYVKGAVVEHFIRKEQLEKKWVLRRAIRFGRGQHRLAPFVKNVRSWRGMPLHLLRDIPKEGFLMIAAWVSFRQGALLRARWSFNALLGKAIEARILAREGRTRAQPRPDGGFTYSRDDIKQDGCTEPSRVWLMGRSLAWAKAVLRRRP